jgi:hypothetical protein
MVMVCACTRFKDGAYEFILKQEGARTAETNKTIFGNGLNLTTFPAVGAIVCHRLRWEAVGKNLKPTKPYVVAKHVINLVANRPKLIVGPNQ